MTPFEQLLATIETLRASVPWNPKVCESVLGVQWGEPDKKSNPYFTILEAHAVRPGPFERAELRLPASGGLCSFLLLWLSPSAGITAKDVARQYPELRLEPASPTAPASEPHRLIVEKPWGTISFAVTRCEAQNVTSVAIEVLREQ